MKSINFLLTWSHIFLSLSICCHGSAITGWGDKLLPLPPRFLWRIELKPHFCSYQHLSCRNKYIWSLALKSDFPTFSTLNSIHQHFAKLVWGRWKLLLESNEVCVWGGGVHISAPPFFTSQHLHLSRASWVTQNPWVDVPWNLVWESVTYSLGDYGISFLWRVLWNIK